MANPRKILCVDCEHDNGYLREIGLVELDLVTLETCRFSSWLVWDNMRGGKAPKKKDISLPHWFTKLTGITNEEYQLNALPLSDVANTIKNVYGVKAWYAWGDDDILLNKVMPGTFINYALIRAHIKNPGENVGIMAQLPESITKSLHAHRALDDAMALAILVSLDYAAIRSL